MQIFDEVSRKMAPNRHFQNLSHGKSTFLHKGGVKKKIDSLKKSLPRHKKRARAYNL